MKYLRRLITTVLLCAVLVPASAQERTDTTYTFRFVAGEDMFYVPWNGNDMELARLLDCIENNKAYILGGRLPLYVDGYCNSRGSVSENLATAKVRSCRVKSELIIRAGVKEENFVTCNHATEGDYVVVRVKAPSNLPREGEAVDSNAHDNNVTMGNNSDSSNAHDNNATMGNNASDSSNAQNNVGNNTSDSSDAQNTMGSNVQDNTQGEPDGKSLHLTGEVGGGFALRANLLRWVTLTPDIGAEWRISPSWGILVNGSWTSWSWSDKKRRYALWEVMPEVRYYIGKNKRGYLGAMFKTGEFNYKLSDTGRQGDLTGGGITGGYLLRMNKALALDFSLGLGYLNVDYEKYEVVNGVRVRSGNETKNWWGPINAGVTLVWKMR